MFPCEGWGKGEVTDAASLRRPPIASATCSRTRSAVPRPLRLPATYWNSRPRARKLVRCRRAGDLTRWPSEARRKRQAGIQTNTGRTVNHPASTALG